MTAPEHAAIKIVADATDRAVRMLPEGSEHREWFAGDLVLLQLLLRLPVLEQDEPVSGTRPAR